MPDFIEWPVIYCRSSTFMRILNARMQSSSLYATDIKPLKSGHNFHPSNMCCSVYKEYLRAPSGAVDIMCFYEDCVDGLDTEKQLYLSRSVGKYEISMCRLDSQHPGFHSSMDISVAGVGTLVVIITHMDLRWS
jgi:hypothetical protein